MKLDLFSKGSTWLVGALLFGAIFFTLASLNERAEQRQAPATSATGAGGLSALATVASATSGEANALRHPILGREDLEKAKTFFLLAPKLTVSDREALLLKDWVKSGGTLVISFQDEKSKLALLPVLKWSSDFETKDEKEFDNGKTFTTGSDHNSDLFREGEHYEIYSPYKLNESRCRGFFVDCYVREATIGNGKVILFLGLPPFSNGLVTHADNAEIAARLLGLGKPLLFDEFHLLISDGNFRELIADPEFTLPALGLLFGILLFFISSPSRIDERKIPQKIERPSFHAFNRRLLRRSVAQSGSLTSAAELHRVFLTKLLPAERQAIAQVKLPTSSNDESGFASAWKLLLFHKNWLKKRRRGR